MKMIIHITTTLLVTLFAYCHPKSEKVTDSSKNMSYSQPISNKLILIQGGTFRMGSTKGTNREKPIHEVTVDKFYLSKYEITQQEWTAVMQNNPSYNKGDALPVEQITWFDAINYCIKRSEMENLKPAYIINGKNVTWDSSANGYRLPTEAEWEFAAIGGNNKPNDFEYSGSNNVDEVAWYSGNSDDETNKVGQKKPNKLGLYDMSGNVWEWCWDLYAPFSEETQNNPTGGNNGSERVLRGGPFYDGAPYVRAKYRGGKEPLYLYKSIGLRIAKSMEKE